MHDRQIIRNYLIPLNDIDLRVTGSIEFIIKMRSDNPEDYTISSISTTIIDNDLLVVVVFDV